MKIALIIISSILTIASTLPYIIEIMRGKAKPRLMSWVTWSLLTGVACVASFAAHQVPAAILMLCATIETMIVVVLGLKYSELDYNKNDAVCQLCALIGLVLGLVFHSPTIAVAICVLVDAFGATPSAYKHAWLKPHEETWSTYLISGLGGLATVLAAGTWKITGVAYPFYIALANFILVTLILTSPHRKKPMVKESIAIAET